MMKRRLWLLAAVAAAALGLQSPAARADFEYAAQLSPTSVLSSGGNVQLTESGIGQANYPNPTAPDFASPNAPDGTDIVISKDITLTPLATGPWSDTLGFTVTVNLAIKDVASGITKTFTFNGTISATVSENASGAGLANFNTDPFGSQSQTQTIGGISYQVTTVPGKQFHAPGAPSGLNPGEQGGYSFHVLATTATVPEPGSMALLGIGLIGAFGVYRRRTARG